MRFSNLFFAAVAAAGALAQATPSINTPSGVVECLPILLTFSGSNYPLTITIEAYTGTGYSTDLVTVGTVTSGTSITWTANLPPAGGGYIAVIRDSAGNLNASGAFQIASGSSTCLTASASSTPVVAGSSSAGTVVPVTTGATTGATTSAAAVVTTAHATTEVPVTTTNAAGSTVTTKAASTVSSAAASTTSKSGAESVSPMGFAGLLGLAGAAVVALF